MSILLENHKRIILLILVSLMLKIAAFGEVAPENTHRGLDKTEEPGLLISLDPGTGGRKQAIRVATKPLYVGAR